jgi:hypothetical protein
LLPALNASTSPDLKLIADLNETGLRTSNELAQRSKCCAFHRAYGTVRYAASQNKSDRKFSLLAEMHANRACIGVNSNCLSLCSGLENKRVSPHLKASEALVIFTTIP